MAILGRTVQFEEALVLLVMLSIIFILFNSFQISRFVYAYLKRRKQKKKDVLSSLQGKKQRAVHELVKKETAGIKGFLRKVRRNMINDPFRVRLFQKTIFSKRNISIGKRTFSVSNIVLWGIFFALVNTIILFSASSLFNRFLHRYPQIIDTYPTQKEVWDDYSRPIEIEFDAAIDYENLIINMAPEVKGRWEFEKIMPNLPFSRKMKFYTEESILPEQKIMIYLTNLSNHLHTFDGGEHLVEFKSIPLPQFESTIPENGAVDVPVFQSIQLQLDQNDGPYVEWDFKLNKDVKFDIIRNQTRIVELVFKNPLDQGEKYKIDIFQTPLSYDTETLETVNKGKKSTIASFAFTTVAAPHVADMSPKGTGIHSDEKVIVNFKHSMDKSSVEKVFSIEPSTEGIISWDNEKTFVFTPEFLQKETHYTVTFKKGIRNSAGGISETKIQFSFDTMGAVTVIQWSPAPYSTGVSTSSSVYMTFGQVVDHSSAQSKFSITPTVQGSLDWNGNTMIFNPSSTLSYNTSYTVSIASGVKSIYGIDSRTTQSSVFTTESQIFSLNVPLYSQTHSKTCNIAAASMLLGYKGISKGEMQFYNEMAKDNTPCNYEANTWGNPHVGFVGSIDGGHSCENGAVRGYGVYWEPISAYLSSNGVSNQIYRGWNVVSLAKEIEKGHPAQIWWQNGWAAPTDVSWYTPGGQYIYAVNGMHSEIVIGFIGSSDNPTHFITNDPWRGRRTLSVGYFDSLWASYFGRTAVVIY